MLARDCCKSPNLYAVHVRTLGVWQTTRCDLSPYSRPHTHRRPLSIRPYNPNKPHFYLPLHDCRPSSGAVYLIKGAKSRRRIEIPRATSPLEISLRVCVCTCACRCKSVPTCVYDYKYVCVSVSVYTCVKLHSKRVYSLYTVDHVCVLFYTHTHKHMYVRVVYRDIRTYLRRD